jgi:hypothetical protein
MPVVACTERGISKAMVRCEIADKFLATSLVETILRVKRGDCSSYASNGMCAHESVRLPQKRSQGDLLESI